MLLENASFIGAALDYGDVCPVFRKEIYLNNIPKLVSAYFEITALGVYEATINGNRVGDFFMAPGWTSYKTRLQVQRYDITHMLTSEKNELCVTVGKGWAISPLAWGDNSHLWADEPGVIACVTLNYTNGEIVQIPTDSSWQCAKSGVLFSEIYDGETYDARVVPTAFDKAKEIVHSKEMLIEQEGEYVTEQEVISPLRFFTTPLGERVIDFGQNLTGFVRFEIEGKAGEAVELSHAEILDKDGNFYTANLRSAKCHIKYICDGKKSVYQPHFTFQGFRFVRIDALPCELDLRCFKAVVMHSDMKRTGYFECSSPKVNQLYKNTVWGQKGNFLDVPTDCPQRNERLGWTGDAEVFIKTAAYHYDVNKFFTKWLHDLRADQHENGAVPHVIPDALREATSAAWGDAATICPWALYLAYGNKQILEDQFDSMKKWVEYIRAQGDNEFLWNTGEHFGDWLSLDCDNSKCDGGTDKYLIATASFANSTEIFVKAGKVLGKDMSEYENLHENIVNAFRDTYMPNGELTCNTQTAHVLAIYFKLTADVKKTALGLAELVKSNGGKLTTGFVGTPYLLYALADNGYTDLAYSLVLEEDYPSWLYSVNQGATTIWEHWDGLRPDGSMWSEGMNSFNHYAYGAVSDFLYSKVAGIMADEHNPGYKHIILAPIIDKRLSYARASLNTAYGTIESAWQLTGDKVTYKFTVPNGCTAEIKLPNKSYKVEGGRYSYAV